MRSIKNLHSTRTIKIGLSVSCGLDQVPGPDDVLIEVVHVGVTLRGFAARKGNTSSRDG